MDETPYPMKILFLTPVTAHMVPGLMILFENIPLGVHSRVFPVEEFPVLAHWTYFDTEATGGPVFSSQFPAAGGTGYLVYQWREIRCKSCFTFRCSPIRIF